MFKGSLTKDYAKQFCQEYPNPKIVKRDESFLYVDSEGNKHQIHDSEHTLGPWQSWPAQIDSFALNVSYAHGNRTADYPTLKHIICLDNSEILTRNYDSQQEYQYTVEQCFMAARAGVINGNLRKIIKRKTEELEGDMPRFLRLFTTKRKIRANVLRQPLLKNLIENFKASIPNYYSGVRNYGLG